MAYNRRTDTFIYPFMTCAPPPHSEGKIAKLLKATHYKLLIIRFIRRLYGYAMAVTCAMHYDSGIGDEDDDDDRGGKPIAYTAFRFGVDRQNHDCSSKMPATTNTQRGQRSRDALYRTSINTKSLTDASATSVITRCSQCSGRLRVLWLLCIVWVDHKIRSIHSTRSALHLPTTKLIEHVNAPY